MLGIDQLAFKSRLRKVAPEEKVFFSLLTLGVCLFSKTILVPVLILGTMSILVLEKGGVPFKEYLKLLALPFSFLLIGVVTIAVGINKDGAGLLVGFPLFGGYIGISEAGFASAFLLFFKAMGAISCLYFMSLTTPMTDLLMVAAKLRIPPLIVELMGLIYRFLFILLETGATMLTAQDSRLGYSSAKASYRSLGALGATLFIRAYKRGERVYTAMEARGYEGVLTVLEEEKPKKRRNYILAVGYNCILILLILLGVN